MPADRCGICCLNFPVDEYVSCPVCLDDDELDHVTNDEPDDADELNTLITTAQFERFYGPADVDEFELAEAAGTLPPRAHILA